MNCLEFRRRCLAEPDTREEDFLRHKRECRTCAALTEHETGFDRLLRQAAAVAVPEDLASRILLRQTTGRRRRQRRLYGWLALAASLVLLVGVARLNHILLFPASLEQAVLNEFDAHPGMLAAQDAMDPEEIRRQFERSGLRLKAPLQGLLRVHYCDMHGVDGLHLVFAGRHGPVSVLVLPKNALTDRIFLADGRRHGYIKPASGLGSLAFLGSPGETFETIEQRLRQAVTL